jgi:hypothetical protein
LVARNPASERWVVLLDPRSIPILFEELEEITTQPDGEHSPAFTDLMLRLSKSATTAIEGLPTRFESGGQEVGRLDVADGCCVFASNTLALSCLSWVLWQQRTGFFLVHELDGS